MKKFKFIYLALMLYALCSSCVTPPIGYGTASLSNKGDNVDKVLTMLNRKPNLQSEVTFKSTGNKYQYLLYNREIMTYSERYRYAWIFNWFSEDKYDLFVYAFKNNKLEFWGNLDEMKTCDDKELNQLAKEISKDYIND